MMIAALDVTLVMNSGPTPQTHGGADEWKDEHERCEAGVDQRRILASGV